MIRLGDVTIGDRYGWRGVTWIENRRIAVRLVSFLLISSNDDKRRRIQSIWITIEVRKTFDYGIVIFECFPKNKSVRKSVERDVTAPPLLQWPLEEDIVDAQENGGDDSENHGHKVHVETPF